MNSTMKALLVTGAAGFIGSHLVEHLVNKGMMVIGYDVFNDYYSTAQKEKNLLEVKDNNLFHLVRGDVRNQETLRKTFTDWDIGSVVHLAAMVGVRNSMSYPELYTSVNVGGTGALLDAASKFGIDKFVLASSSSVYGDRKTVPFRETDNTDLPCSIYAATKKAAEVLAHSFYNLYGISTACLRFFTVYGPRGRPDQAPLKFIDRISSGTPIQQFGDGSSSRDYTYVADIVSGIMAAIDASYQYEIFNLGSANPIQLVSFIRAIEKHVGKTAIIEKLPNQPGDVFQTLADIEKSKRLLGYEPKFSLDDGLKLMVEWYNSSAPIF